MDSIIFAVDFDGTCTAHDFPRLGADIGAAPVLRELVNKGHRLILWTMRDDKTDKKYSDPAKDSRVYIPSPTERTDYLSQAVSWFERNRIPLWGIQTNPTQSTWTGSPKCYAHIYLDDAALGCPLTFDVEKSGLAFVDWVEMRKLLVQRGLL